MRRTFRISLCLACVCLLQSCAEPRLECGTDQVKRTLASIVHDHFLRVALDRYAFAHDADRTARFRKAVSVTARDVRQVSWDKDAGQLTCAASVVIEAPGPDGRSTIRKATLAYRVTGGDDNQFFVEVAYPDLVAVVSI